MNGPASPARLDNLISWFAAAVTVTAGVIYALRQHDKQSKSAVAFVPPRASPAQEPLGLQTARAAEIGRGRLARTPHHIPWRGWKDILLRTYYEIQEDRLFALAAGVVFYSLLALFPAIAAGVSVYALFANADAGMATSHSRKQLCGTAVFHRRNPGLSCCGGPLGL